MSKPRTGAEPLTPAQRVAAFRKGKAHIEFYVSCNVNELFKSACKSAGVSGASLFTSWIVSLQETIEPVEVSLQETETLQDHCKKLVEFILHPTAAAKTPAAYARLLFGSNLAVRAAITKDNFPNHYESAQPGQCKPGGIGFNLASIKNACRGI